MKMTIADQNRFPKSVRYIRKILPKVLNIATIRREMLRHGQLNRKAFSTALGWGTPPNIDIVAGLAACGSYTPTAGNDTIQILEQIFTDFENGGGQLQGKHGPVPALGLNLLHEMTHWGDNQDGVIDRSRIPGVHDGGDAFELAVYGRDLQC